MLARASCQPSTCVLGVTTLLDFEVETMAWLKLPSISVRMGDLIAPQSEMWPHRPVVEQHDGDVSHMSKPQWCLSQA